MKNYYMNTKQRGRENPRLRQIERALKGGPMHAGELRTALGLDATANIGPQLDRLLYGGRIVRWALSGACGKGVRRHSQVWALPSWPAFVPPLPEPVTTKPESLFRIAGRITIPGYRYGTGRA